MGVKNYAQQRYKVIDNLLTNSMRRYPTMNDIIEKCEERIQMMTNKSPFNLASLKSDGSKRMSQIIQIN